MKVKEGATETATQSVDDILLDLKKSLADRNTHDEQVNTRIELIEKAVSDITAKADDEDEKFGFKAHKEDVEKFSFAKTIYAIARGTFDRNVHEAFKQYAKLEYELINAQYDYNLREGLIAKARHQSAVDASGGMFIPEQVSSEVIEVLRSKLILESQLGVTVYPNIKGDKFKIPRQTGRSSAGWVKEGQAPAEQQISFDSIEFEPHYCSNLVTISNKLLALAPQAVEKMIRDDLAKQLRLAMDYSFLFGSGGVEPLGLYNLLGTGATYRTQLKTGVGAQFNYDHAEIFRNTIEERDVDGEVSFLSRPSTWSVMKRIKVDNYAGQATNQPYLAARPPMSNQMLEGMLGGKFAKSTAVPKTTAATGAINTAGTGTASFVFAGVWEEFALAFWNRLGMRLSREASIGNRSSFLQDETWIVFEAAADCNVLRKEAFQYCDDALQS